MANHLRRIGTETLELSKTTNIPPASLHLAVIPGDGIGPEVIEPALEIMRALCPVPLRLSSFHLGAERYVETGEVLPEAEQQQIRATDAILFGAVGGVPGDPRLAGANVERDLLLKLRFDFQQAVNLRPVRSFPGLPGPLRSVAEGQAIDLVVIREGTEGAYSGTGGRLRPGSDQEVASEVSLNTHRGVRRVVEYAFQLAERRRQQLTLVHKTNVLIYAGALWERIFAEAAAAHPQVTCDYLHVDAAAMALVEDPQRFDVLVTDNLFGDIITDIAGAVGGGIGLAASGNLNLDGSAPSMFEPVHGSAPDIAGKNLADPRAAILSAGLLLEHCGWPEPRSIIENAIAADIAEQAGQRSGSQPQRSTAQIGHDILARCLAAASPRSV